MINRNSSPFLCWIAILSQFLTNGFLNALLGFLIFHSTTSSAIPRDSTLLFEPVNQALERFETDSKSFMNETPPKILRPPKSQSRTPVNYFLSENFNNISRTLSPIPDIPNKKIASRCKCQKEYQSFFSGVHLMASWDLHNRPELFFDEPQLINQLTVMDRLGFQTSYIEETPWSGDYFAIARGILGNRAFDPKFMQLYDWKSRYDYVQEYPFAKIFAQGRSQEINQLSVSEKYDLLLGDQQGHLTISLWDQGRQYYESTGEVEEWMGICHGWAPASYLVPRPYHSITAMAFDGRQKIKINPGEIKGLVSQQWAQNPVSSRFVGQRCNSKDPQQDENGRVIETGCFDVNPGAWHLIVVNKIAKERKSFVFDATFDYQVWNQPVYGYKYTYFNPITNKEVKSLEKAIILRKDFNTDKFATYRASETKFIVGIAMELSYSVETTINQNDTDTPEDDYVTKVRYLYDLELNDQGQIIGGEWYTNKHPDFLWTPESGEVASSPIDAQIKHFSWQPDQPTPALWQKAATYTSPHGLILGPFVESLIEQSRKNP